MKGEGNERLTRVVTWQQRAIEGVAHDEVFVPRGCSLVRALSWEFAGKENERRGKEEKFGIVVNREEKDIHSIPLTVSSLKS